MTSIILFRKPTAGDYVYPGYANALGWLMVCSSLMFIPLVMIYELIKAWRVTSHPQPQVRAFVVPQRSFVGIDCPYKIDERMPHYLRMLTYASQPEAEWGPAKDENRTGRYKPKAANAVTSSQSKVSMGDENFAFDSEHILRTRL